jgi:hypothetical protein
LRWRALAPIVRLLQRTGVLAESSILAALVICAAWISPTEAIAVEKSRQTQIEYIAPKNPAYQNLYEELKQARVLEYVKDMLDVVQLPRPLALKFSGCDGVSNAWYHEQEVTVCYEYAEEIVKNAAEENALPAGISRIDTIVGPLLDVFLHEAGHAVFKSLKIPIFGREEDAADQFSSIIMMQYDPARARRLILGSAYQYKPDVKQAQRSIDITKFSDEHGHPAQRFFNVLCIAYGADPKLFSDIVEKGYLPKNRAEGCAGEYQQTSYAFRTLISPHIDKPAARKALKRRYKS